MSGATASGPTSSAPTASAPTASVPTASVPGINSIFYVYYIIVFIVCSMRFHTPFCHLMLFYHSFLVVKYLHYLLCFFSYFIIHF